MKHFLCLLLICTLSAQNPTPESIEIFYNEYILQGRQSLVNAETAPPYVSSSLGSAGPPPPPSTPQDVVLRSGYFPVVISKPSNIDASRIYLLSFSPNVAANALLPAAPPALYQLLQSFPGQMATVPITEDTFSPNYAYTLDQFPTVKTDSENEFLLYFPNGVQSVRIYVSIDQPLYALVGGNPLSLIPPSSFQFNDPNFNVVYDFLELTLTALENNQPHTPVQPFMDTSQVDNLGLSILLQIFEYNEANPSASEQLLQNMTATTNTVGYTLDRDILFGNVVTDLGSNVDKIWPELVIPFSTTPYDPPGGSLTPPYLRILSPKISSQIAAVGAAGQPLGGKYTIPFFPSDFLTNPNNGKGGVSILKAFFGYYATPHSFYVQPDASFGGSGEIYSGVVSGSSPNSVFTFTSSPSNHVITLNEADITVEGMYSGTVTVTGSNGASPTDQLLVSAYVSGAFITGLLGGASPAPFEVVSSPLNAANLQNHILSTNTVHLPPSAPVITDPPYYDQDPLGSEVTLIQAYDLFAKALHKEAALPTIPPYPNPVSGNTTPQTGLAYAYDYDDKLGVSSTVSPNNLTSATAPIYCKYTIQDVGALPTTVFDDPISYTLNFQGLPPNVVLEYRQGSSGAYSTISASGQTISNVTATSANPFQIRYTASDGRVVEAVLFPKYQFAQPLTHYRQLESGIILGIKFSPHVPSDTSPHEFDITMPGFPTN